MKKDKTGEGSTEFGKWVVVHHYPGEFTPAALEK
jgi:hypothetical protein